MKFYLLAGLIILMGLFGCGGTGSTASPGTKDVPGAAGAQGPMGPAGPMGMTGITGPIGPAGAVGQPGTQGQMGPAGTPGTPGQAGSVGPMGAPGPAGAVGPAGSGLNRSKMYKVQNVITIYYNSNTGQSTTVCNNAADVIVYGYCQIVESTLTLVISGEVQNVTDMTMPMGYQCNGGSYVPYNGSSTMANVIYCQTP